MQTDITLTLLSPLLSTSLSNVENVLLCINYEQLNSLFNVYHSFTVLIHHSLSSKTKQNS